MSDEPSFNNSRLALNVGVVDNEDIGQEMQHAPKDSANLAVMEESPEEDQSPLGSQATVGRKGRLRQLQEANLEWCTSHCTVLVKLEQHHLAIWHCMEIVDSLVQGMGSPVMECKYHHLLE